MAPWTRVLSVPNVPSGPAIEDFNRLSVLRPSAVLASTSRLSQHGSQNTIPGLSILATFLAFFCLLILLKYLFILLRRHHTIHNASEIFNCSVTEIHKKWEAADIPTIVDLENADEACFELGNAKGSVQRTKGWLTSPVLVGLLGSPEWEIKVSVYINQRLQRRKQNTNSAIMSPPISRPLSFASASEHLGLTKPPARIQCNDSSAHTTTRPLSTPILLISAATPEKATRRNVCDLNSPTTQKPERALAPFKTCSGSTRMKPLRHLSAPPTLDLPSFLTLRSSMESINTDLPARRSAGALDTSFQSTSTATNASSGDLKLNHLSSFPSPPGFTSTPNKFSAAISCTLPSRWRLGSGFDCGDVQVKKPEASYHGLPTIKLVSQSQARFSRPSYKKAIVPVATAGYDDHACQTPSLLKKLKPLQATLDLTLSRSESVSSSSDSGNFGTFGDNEGVDALGLGLGLGYYGEHGDPKIRAPTFRLSVEDYDLKTAADAAIAGRPHSLMAILEDTGLSSVDPIDMTI